MFFARFCYICNELKYAKRVKKLLKYIVPLLLTVVAIVGCGENSHSAVKDNRVNLLQQEQVTDSLDSYTLCSVLSLQHQISCSNIVHLQGTARRTNYVQKINFEFTKACKCINTGISNFAQNESTTIHSTFIRPAQRLIRLGKLLI